MMDGEHQEKLASQKQLYEYQMSDFRKRIAELEESNSGLR